MNEEHTNKQGVIFSGFLIKKDKCQETDKKMDLCTQEEKKKNTFWMLGKK